MHRRCLGYPPGFISLIFLPLLCLLYFQNRGVFEKKRAIAVFKITKEFYEPPRSRFLTFKKPPERRNFEVVLTGDEKFAKSQLDSAKHILHFIVGQRDTVHGVYFTFTDRSKYWMFVRALDICKAEKSTHFVTLENDVRAYYAVPDTIGQWKALPRMHDCGTAEEWSKSVSVRLKQEAELAQQNLRLSYLAALWPSGLALLALGFLAFRNIVFRETL